MRYHDQMCQLALDYHKNHIIKPRETRSDDDAKHAECAWILTDPSRKWFTAVEIRAVAFGRLVVHGSCEPIVFGNYVTEEFRHHPIVHMIGERESMYLDYVVGKTIPRAAPYYDSDTALGALPEARKALQAQSVSAEQVELLMAGLKDRIHSDDWPAVQTFLYDYFDFDTEDIARFGRVMAPPNFYYAVFAVKRLWDLLEGV